MRIQLPEGANLAWRLARVPGLSAEAKLGLLWHKYAYLAAHALQMPVSERFRFNGRPYRCDSFIDPGFLLFHLVHLYESFATMGLLRERGLTIVDVGAHHGETILGLDLLLDKPSIYAFEPNPACWGILESNTEGIPIHLFKLGLGDSNGRATFNLDDRFSGWHTFAYGEPPRASIEVEMRRGDDVLHLPKIDVLKIDVEGFEYQALAGLEDTLHRCRYLMLELSLERRKAYRFDQIASLLGRFQCDIVRASLAAGANPGRPPCIDLCISLGQPAGACRPSNSDTGDAE